MIMDKMKKGVVFFCLGILLIFMFLIQAVSAAPSLDVDSIVKSVQDFFRPILSAIFGGQEANLFSLLLFALIIIAACYLALDNIPVFQNNQFALWAITIAVAILAVRFIGTIDVVQQLLFPQGVFGIALITIIPLALYFWFVEIALAGPNYRVLRRIAWAVLAAVFMVLWWKTSYGSMTGSVVGSSVASDWGWIYLIAGIISVVIMLIDKTIQRAIEKSRIESATGVYSTKIKAALMRARAKLEEDYAEGRIDKSIYDTLDRDLKEKEKHHGMR